MEKQNFDVSIDDLMSVFESKIVTDESDKEKDENNEDILKGVDKHLHEIKLALSKTSAKTKLAKMIYDISLTLYAHNQSGDAFQQLKFFSKNENLLSKFKKEVVEYNKSLNNVSDNTKKKYKQEVAEIKDKISDNVIPQIILGIVGLLLCLMNLPWWITTIAVSLLFIAIVVVNSQYYKYKISNIKIDENKEIEYIRDNFVRNISELIESNLDVKMDDLKISPVMYHLTTKVFVTKKEFREYMNSLIKDDQLSSEVGLGDYIFDKIKYSHSVRRTLHSNQEEIKKMIDKKRNEYFKNL